MRQSRALPPDRRLSPESIEKDFTAKDRAHAVRVLCPFDADKQAGSPRWQAILQSLRGSSCKLFLSVSNGTEVSKPQHIDMHIAITINRTTILYVYIYIYTIICVDTQMPYMPLDRFGVHILPFEKERIELFGENKKTSGNHNKPNIRTLVSGFLLSFCPKKKGEKVTPTCRNQNGLIPYIYIYML